MPLPNPGRGHRLGPRAPPPAQGTRTFISSRQLAMEQVARPRRDRHSCTEAAGEGGGERSVRHQAAGTARVLTWAGRPLGCAGLARRGAAGGRSGVRLGPASAP